METSVLCAVVARCSSLTSHASDVLQPATTVCTSLTEVPTAPASSSCYDNGAVGGVGVAVTGGTVVSNVTSRDLWCPDGRPSMADTWSSSNDLEDLAELFSRIGLGKYTDIFQKQEVSEYDQFIVARLCVPEWTVGNSVLPCFMQRRRHGYKLGMAKRSRCCRC